MAIKTLVGRTVETIDDSMVTRVDNGGINGNDGILRSSAAYSMFKTYYVDLSSSVDRMPLCPDGMVVIPYSPVPDDVYEGNVGYAFYNYGGVYVTGGVFPKGNYVDGGSLCIHIPHDAFRMAFSVQNRQLVQEDVRYVTIATFDSTSYAYPNPQLSYQVPTNGSTISIPSLFSTDFKYTSTTNVPYYANVSQAGNNLSVRVDSMGTYVPRRCTIMVGVSFGADIKIPIVINQTEANNPYKVIELDVNNWYNNSAVFTGIHNGDFIPSNDHKRTDYIDCYKYQGWTLLLPFLNGSVNYGLGMAFYDRNKNFISDVGYENGNFNETTKQITIPENADTFISTYTNSDAYGDFYAWIIDIGDVVFPDELFSIPVLIKDGNTYSYTSIENLDDYKVDIYCHNSWYSMTYTSPTTFRLTVQENTGNDDRTGVIDITLSYYGKSQTYTITFIQKGTNVYQPIWKDHYIEFNDKIHDYVTYQIEIVGNTDFNYVGRVYPDVNGDISFKINDIVDSYLSNSIKFESANTTNDNGIIEVNVYTSYDNLTTKTKFDTVKFIYDWTYDEGIWYSGYLSNPIQKILDPRQYFVFTTNFKSGTPIILSNYRSINNRTITLTTFNSVDNPTNIVYKVVHGNGNEYILNNTFRYEVKNTCYRYCIYYLNEKGGWDWLLVDGSDVKNIKYTRDTYRRNYNNNNTTDAGIINYNTNKDVTYKLTTGYLNDEQSEKMMNLFSSNQIYLHDMVNDVIKSVLIDNNATDLKTFRNQGRQMFTYTLNLYETQDKIRK